MADLTDLDQPTDYGQQEAQRAAGFDSVKGFEKQRDVLKDGIVGALARAISFFFASVGQLAVILLKGLYAAMGELDPAFGAIAATVVGNMFDVDVDSAAFASMTDRAARKKIGGDVGAALLRAMQGDAAGLGPGELQPGVDAAQNFLGVMANLAIEGWAMDLVGEVETVGYIKNLGELNDRMASIMGLGRLSRTVLRPFVNTLIATPATWKVNQQYRPTMLSPAEAIAANIRGDVADDVLQEILTRHGYGDDAIAALRNGALSTLTPADGKLLVDAGQIDQEFAIQDVQRAGHTRDRAELLYGLETVRALRRFELEMIGAAVSAYAEHRIDKGKLDQLLAATTLDTVELARLSELAAQRRLLNAPHLSHGEVIAAVKGDVLNVTDYAAWLTARGYSDVDAVTLELVLQNDLNTIADKAKARAAAAATRAATAAAKLQALQAKRDELAAFHADWTGTLGEAERLVVRNIMPATQYRQVLIDHRLSPGDADALVTVALADRDTYAAAQAKKTAAALKTSTPAIAVAALERATTIGALSLDQLRAELTARKYGPADVDVMIDLVKDAQAARAAALARTTAAAAKLAGKSISLSAVQKAVADGVQTIAQYAAFLTAQQFDPTSIATLVADMQIQLDNRALANARHDAAAAQLAGSHLSLAQEEKAVIDGILTLADYTLWLQSHGFDVADQAILTQLLETKLT